MLTICCWQDEAATNLADCVLKHLVISHEYDVYSSYSHPRRAWSSHCRRLASHQDVSPSSSRADRRCRRRWYLGVNRRGHVRTIKTSRQPPPMKTFFYKLWLHKRTAPTQHPPFSIRPRIPNHFAATSTPPPPSTTAAGGRRGRKKGRRKWSRPAFPLLSYGRRRNGSRPTTMTGDDDATATSVEDHECGSNLLSSCGRRRNSSEDSPSRDRRRRGGRRRSTLIRSL